MNRPSKKDIKASIEKLKDKSPGTPGASDHGAGKLTEKKTSQRIRKQGV